LSYKTEFPDHCITAARAYYKKGGCYGRQACRLDVDKCYDSMLKGLSKELTLVLSDTRELDRVLSTK